MNDLNKLDGELQKLKDYSDKHSFETLNKKIYNLDFNQESLSKMSQEDLQYIHVKLHTSLSYKKPFAEFGKIKKIHDQVASLLENHIAVDRLDR